MMIKEILEINDVQSKNKPRPLITLNTSSALSCKWLLDTSVAISCMSIEAFRKILINKRPKKSITKREYVDSSLEHLFLIAIILF
jgi:hypothetical protein